MTEDIDAWLRADAKEWNGAQAAPGELAGVIDRAVDESARHRGRWVLPALSAAAVLLLVVGAVWVRNMHSRQSAVAPLVTNGVSLPYLGDVPWGDAVVNGRDPDAVTVYADSDALRDAHVTCDRPALNAQVQEQGDRVRITVRGYGTPASDGDFCDAIAYGAQPVRLELDAPLGQRTLVDARSDQTHQVLNTASVPGVADLPPGYTAEPVTWNEATGVVRRAYSVDGNVDRHLEMQFEPADSHEALVALKLDFDSRTDIDLNGRTAILSTYSDRPGSTTFSRVCLAWTRADGSRIGIVSSGEGVPLPQDQVIAAARSVPA